MSEYPDVITVEASRREELAADRADLYVTIKGTSLFTGDETLKKAREVAALVADLTASGLPTEAIFLEGVSVETASGTVLKTSQATYRLRVRCAQIERLADTLGIIANQKNATLRHLKWGYPDDEAVRDRLLTECITRANAKAAKIAAALGVNLLGIRQFSEQIEDRENGAFAERGITGAAMYRSRSEPMTAEDMGLEVSHSKEIAATVKVYYRISGFEKAAP